jgi:cell division septum initiation protein DivIVA
MVDPRERVRADESRVEQFWDFLPGFRGYREREVRRRADQLLRDYLVGLLDRERARLQRKAAELSRAVRVAAAAAVDRLLAQLTKARDKLRYADYGYTGWFDTPRLREQDLDRLYEYDLCLRELVAGLQERVEAVEKADESSLPARLHDLEAAIQELAERIEGRAEIVAQTVPE